MTIERASDNPFPSVLFRETVDPANPASGDQRLFVDTDHLLKLRDSAGTVTTFSTSSGAVATDVIWDAAGDLVQGTGANTAAKLTAGTSAMFLKSAGAAAANLWAFPPGHEFNYVQITSPVAITASSEATANTVVTAGSVTYDGSTVVMIEFFCPDAYTDNVATVDMLFYLYDAAGGGAAGSIGEIGVMRPETNNRSVHGMYARVRLTPSAAAHVYSVRAASNAPAGDGSVNGGSGGSGALVPAFIRQSKV